MGDLQATTLTGRETILLTASVEEFKKSLRGQLIASGDEDYAEARPRSGTRTSTSGQA